MFLEKNRLTDKFSRKVLNFYPECLSRRWKKFDFSRGQVIEHGTTMIADTEVSVTFRQITSIATIKSNINHKYKWPNDIS